MRQEISLTGEEASTGYGVKMAHQDKVLSKLTGFEVAEEWTRGEIFYLELLKIC